MGGGEIKKKIVLLHHMIHICFEMKQDITYLAMKVMHMGETISFVFIFYIYIVRMVRFSLMHIFGKN